ncbi:MAG: NAD-dependent epimerase/dehydratase family protein [Nanoarchaeota archaeon]|nr:NAD-dependent epimerase/dehydratase family protein [Nanoarchaeota archaeon]
MKKVLVTGGAGFIGYHLSKELSHDCEVFVLDNFVRGKKDELFEELLSKSNVHLLDVDLTSQGDIAKIGSDYDEVYHLASINGTENFYTIPAKLLRNNTLVNINILDWFINSGSKRILISSSSEFYADAMTHIGLRIPTPENVPFHLNDVSNPRWTYAASKLIGEMAFINYERDYNIDMRIIRYHNVYGPRMGDKHVIPNFLERVYNNANPFNILGNNTRAFCFVSDTVKATIQVMRSDECSGQTIHVGNDSEEIRMADLAKTMFEVLGHDVEIKFKPSPEGSVDRRCPDISKLRKLGFKQQVSLKQGIFLTHEYYRKVYS